MNSNETFDVVIVGGGPAGATAAHDLARQGRSVMLLDRAGRIKPCGGAIPPRLIKDFEIPDELLVAKARSARMISPKVTMRCVVLIWINQPTRILITIAIPIWIQKS
jgi:geranylgeranyl reductase